MPFIVIGRMGDQEEGVWNGRGELHKDWSKAKVYMLRSSAELVAGKRGFRIVELAKPETREIHVGDRLDYRGGAIRVMAIAEGYAMVRRPGAMPFVVSLKELRA